MSESNEVLSEPTLERRTRRRFSAAEKQRLLAEADALKPESLDPVLEGIDLEVPAGSTLALVGRTGTGKRSGARAGEKSSSTGGTASC